MVKHELHGPPRAVGEVEIRKAAFPEPFKDAAISFMSLLIVGPTFFWGGVVGSTKSMPYKGKILHLLLGGLRVLDLDGAVCVVQFVLWHF